MVDLAGAVVILRAWRESDAAWYAGQVRDPAIQRFTTEPGDLTVQQAAHNIRHAKEQTEQVGWAITLAGTGELVGNAALDLSTGEVSYWVAPAARGRGIATAAVQLMVDYAFSATALPRLLLWVHPDNLASARVAEGASFTRRADLDRIVRLRDSSICAHYYAIDRGGTEPAKPATHSN